jgi:hypothetical protein
MQWINETEGDQTHQALVLRPDEALLPAFVELRKRILSDGIATARTSDWMSLSIDIQDRQVMHDTQGCMHAVFRNGQRKHCKSPGHFVVRGDAFDFLQGRDEDNDTFNRREIRWLLEQYRLLKEAANNAEVHQLLQTIKTIRPLAVDAATAQGWLDLQVGQDSFGRLPSADQAMLADLDPGPINPLADLTAGVMEIEPLDLVQELNAALIAYTPPNFEVICCAITQGTEQGQPALFYNIQCPQFPADGTTVVNDRVHRAATRLVREMTPLGGVFRGLAIELELQADGTWLHSLTPMSAVGT